MRKIKSKPVKKLRFKPPKGTVIRYVAPLEAMVLAQESYERYDRRQTWQRMQAWFRGEPVQSEAWL